MLEFPIPPCHVTSPAAILDILPYTKNLSQFYFMKQRRKLVKTILYSFLHLYRLRIALESNISIWPPSEYLLAMLCIQKRFSLICVDVTRNEGNLLNKGTSHFFSSTNMP